MISCVTIQERLVCEHQTEALQDSTKQTQCSDGHTPQVTPQVSCLLKVITGEMSRETLQDPLELQDRKSFRQRYLKPALAEGLIEMTIPDKPNSRLQKYCLTHRGEQWLELSGDK